MKCKYEEIIIPSDPVYPPSYSSAEFSKSAKYCRIVAHSGFLTDKMRFIFLPRTPVGDFRPLDPLITWIYSAAAPD